MNRVKILQRTSKKRNYKLGDIFENENGQAIMVTQCGSGGYNTILLENGECWTGVEPEIEGTLTNVTFVGRNMKITIES